MNPEKFTGKLVTKEGRPYDFGADYHLPIEETHVASFAAADMQQDLYERYPAFEENLRILVSYMDSQKPGGLRGLWYDKRDSGAWYTFWAVGSPLYLILRSDLSLTPLRSCGLEE